METGNDIPVLKVSNLDVAFDGKVVLSSASFSVGAHECLAIMGPSGSGKSVLLRCINRLLEPTAGTIELAGTDIATLDPIAVRRRICLVGQIPSLYEGSVADNLAYAFSFASNRDLEKPDFSEILVTVGLHASLLDQEARTLSGGEQQRVCIARALCLNPEILLLDEPTGGLDEEAAGVLARTIRHLNRDEGRTIVLVTHDEVFARSTGERILILKHGRIEPVREGSG